jgi:cold shock CspA family protein
MHTARYEGAMASGGKRTEFLRTEKTKGGVPMKAATQITFRNMKSSPIVEDWIREEMEKLETLYGRLMGCRVALEIPHRHHKKGSPYHIRIDLTVPGGEIVVKREPSLNARARHLGQSLNRKHAEIHLPHKELRQAIDDAFRAAGRRLQDYARRQRGDVKSRARLPEGRISRVSTDGEYGFIAAEDGREIYFHKNSVIGKGIPSMSVGTAVRFAEEAGEKGPQASAVHLVAKQGSRQPAIRKAASAR